MSEGTPAAGTGPAVQEASLRDGWTGLLKGPGPNSMLHLRKILPPSHSSPVWLLGCNFEESSQCSPKLKPVSPCCWEGQDPASASVGCSLDQSFLLTPEGKPGSRVATVPSLPCPSHRLWLQIRCDWWQWVLVDITEVAADREQRNPRIGGHRRKNTVPSSTHANTCLKHKGHTRAVGLKWAGN